MGFPGKAKFPIYSLIFQRVTTRVSFQQWPVLSTTLTLNMYTCIHTSNFCCRYETDKALETHKWVHSDENKCDKCPGRTFKQKSHWEDHMHIHSGARPYTCKCYRFNIKTWSKETRYPLVGTRSNLIIIECLRFAITCTVYKTKHWSFIFSQSIFDFILKPYRPLITR